MVDEEVVATKLKQVHEYTNDLEEMRGLSKENYVSDVVYDVLHEDLHWFERFQREVAQWLRQREP